MTTYLLKMSRKLYGNLARGKESIKGYIGYIVRYLWVKYSKKSVMIIRTEAKTQFRCFKSRHNHEKDFILKNIFLKNFAKETS